MGREARAHASLDIRDDLDRVEDLRREAPKEPAKRCDHKFVDSNICLECGWEPGVGTAEHDGLRHLDVRLEEQPRGQLKLDQQYLGWLVRKVKTPAQYERILRKIENSVVRAEVRRLTTPMLTFGRQ